MNVSDEDAERYIKIFTLLDQPTIEQLITEHRQAPHLRLLQKTLAKELTCMIHSEAEYEKAVAASGILFGNATQTLCAGWTNRPSCRYSKAFPISRYPPRCWKGVFRS